jgi:hypothetical protein
MSVAMFLNKQVLASDLAVLTFTNSVKVGHLSHPPLFLFGRYIGIIDLAGQIYT